MVNFHYIFITLFLFVTSITCGLNIIVPCIYLCIVFGFDSTYTQHLYNIFQFLFIQNTQDTSCTLILLALFIYCMNLKYSCRCRNSDSFVCLTKCSHFKVSASLCHYNRCKLVVVSLSLVSSNKYSHITSQTYCVLTVILSIVNFSVSLVCLYLNTKEFIVNRFLLITM